MNRRDLLKAIGVAPLAHILRGYGSTRTEAQSAASTDVQTLQIVLEGGFALVLQRKPNRLTAFVPKHPTIKHRVFFNDPRTPLSPMKEGAFQFELSPDGLETYSQPYINPGFRDFNVHTDLWNQRVENLIRIELPFPNSINFSGRPLRVRFKAGLRPGLMPTSHILEYYVKDIGRTKLGCQQLGRECNPLPNSPPRVATFFFGVAPNEGESDSEHAKTFFNFMLKESFPHLFPKLALSYIQPGPHSRREPDRDKPASLTPKVRGRVRYAVLRDDASPQRLLRVSEILDCQSGGIITNRP